jgi:excisionase family DNA binding protein
MDRPSQKASTPSGSNDPAKAHAVVDKLYTMAMRGNVAAASVFLDRVLGAVRVEEGSGQVGGSTSAQPADTRRESRVSPEAPQPTRPRTLLSVEEVSKELGLSKALVYQLGKRGRLPICRIGRRVLVRATDLEQFIRTNSSGPGLPA